MPHTSNTAKPHNPLPCLMSLNTSGGKKQGEKREMKLRLPFKFETDGEWLMPNAVPTLQTHSLQLHLSGLAPTIPATVIFSSHFDLGCTFALDLVLPYRCRFHRLRSANKPNGLPVEPSRQRRRPAFLHKDLPGSFTAGMSVGSRPAGKSSDETSHSSLSAANPQHDFGSQMPDLPDPEWRRW